MDNQNNTRIIGKIYYYWEGGIAETMEYTDKEKYLSAIEHELNYNPNGFRYETLTQDADTRKAVDDTVYGMFGEDNPHSIEFYYPKSEILHKEKERIENKLDEEKNRLSLNRLDIKDIHIFSLKAGGYAINATINGEKQLAEKLSKEDVNAYFDEHKVSAKGLVQKYFKDALYPQEDINNSIKR